VLLHRGFQGTPVDPAHVTLLQLTPATADDGLVPPKVTGAILASSDTIFALGVKCTCCTCAAGSPSRLAGAACVGASGDWSVQPLMVAVPSSLLKGGTGMCMLSATVAVVTRQFARRLRTAQAPAVTGAFIP
jgi:hypothetical protein